MRIPHIMALLPQFPNHGAGDVFVDNHPHPNLPQLGIKYTRSDLSVRRSAPLQIRHEMHLVAVGHGPGGVLAAGHDDAVE